jgi:hypothetical protein
MSYIVTHGMGHGPQPIDMCPTLNDALVHACQLLLAGQPNVTIRDGKGQSISGPDLIACCSGEKTLTADLKAN